MTEPLNFAEVVLAVIIGNALTVGWIYGLWRINRNENEHFGKLLFLGVCAIGLFVAYASAP